MPWSFSQVLLKTSYLFPYPIFSFLFCSLCYPPPSHVQRPFPLSFLTPLSPIILTTSLLPTVSANAYIARVIPLGSLNISHSLLNSSLAKHSYLFSWTHTNGTPLSCHRYWQSSPTCLKKLLNVTSLKYFRFLHQLNGLLNDFFTQSEKQVSSNQPVEAMETLKMKVFKLFLFWALFNRPLFCCFCRRRSESVCKKEVFTEKNNGENCFFLLKMFTIGMQVPLCFLEKNIEVFIWEITYPSR